MGTNSLQILKVFRPAIAKQFSSKKEGTFFFFGSIHFMCSWLWNIMVGSKSNDDETKKNTVEAQRTKPSQHMAGAPLTQAQPVGGAQHGYQPVPHPAEAYAASPQVYPQPSQPQGQSTYNHSDS